MGSPPEPKGIVPVSSTYLERWIKRLDEVIKEASELRAQLQKELDEYRGKKG